MANNRNNYKSKWLAALEKNASTPGQAADNVVKSLDTAHLVAADATISINKIQHAAIEAASVAMKVMKTLDEFRYVAGIDFGESGHGVDDKLTTMPLPVVMRRMRDILRICETRLGILSICAEETYQGLQRAENRANAAAHDLSPLQASVVSTAWLGASPTNSDLEDFNDKKGQDYHRHGIIYEDLEDDWFDTRVSKTTVLRQNRNNKNASHSNARGDDDDSSGSDDEDSQSSPSKSLVKAHNRSASLIPGSPKNTRKETFVL